ncbi:phosphatase PAP2 family protein [Isoptericola sp. G70]|uniref:phosphatase PAP2 family protein n=1 Tax=Isoptericola sp. G70 TaxID=3376633 RepID=UPI003A805A2E
MSRRALLLTGAACAVGCALVYLVSVHTAPGRGADEWLRLRVVVGLDWFEPVGELLRRVFPLLLAAVVVMLGVLALVRRRWAAVTTALLVVAVSTVAAYGLRQVLDRPGAGTGLSGGPDVNTFPSTHVAATTALVLAVVLLWPREPTPAVLTGAAFLVVAAALGSVVNHAHRPGDVVGSVLLVAAVTATALGVLGRGAVRRGRLPGARDRG